MTLRQFQVRRDDLATHRIVEGEQASLADGEVRAKVDRFALTANNITYGVVGERIGYWKFFEPLDNDGGGWGIIPVWGFAEIVESHADGVAVGDRIYGYFPMASELVMQPVRANDQRMIDGAAHRTELPPVYNTYSRIPADADRDLDDERMLLHPLYATSFCLHDFLTDNAWFGAKRVIVVSASSKTAIGLAQALADDPAAPPSLGLTSERNRDFVRSLMLYDTVVTYDGIDTIDADVPTVIVDMSGAGAVLARLHARLGDSMRFCSNVGVTHWEDSGMQPGFIRERSEMFFAPGHIRKRAGDWGPGEFERRATAFWRGAALKSRSWLNIRVLSGLGEMVPVFEELRAGHIAPDTGIVVSQQVG